ncbi:hypothetical protein BC829DRAFT_420724 [Chytridium lagenaria]|nr:hypothetical protein BC829DRAFT_420724 [Chytridium lagenaria]
MTLKSFRFNPSIDVELLKLVLDLQPFAAGYGKVKDKWQAVADGLRAIVTDFGENYKPDSLNPAAARRRFDTLVDSFKKEEMDSLRASGTDEEYEERERLLTDILEMMEFHELEKAEKNEKERAEAQKKEARGEAIVRAASMGLVKTSGKGKRGNNGDTEMGGDALSDVEGESKDGQPTTESAAGSSRKKQRRSDLENTSTATVLLKWFEDKESRKIVDHAMHEQKMVMEEKKLGLEEKRLGLEEKKLEELKAERIFKEEKEREYRKEREEKDRRLMESQNVLIQSLLNLVAKNNNS